MPQRGKRAKEVVLRRPRRWLRHAVLTSAAGATLAGVTWYGAAPYIRTGRLRATLATARAEQVLPTLRQLAESGKPGLRVLVEALAAPSTRDDAYQILQREIERASKLPISQRDGRLDLLADLLTDASPGYDKDSLALAAQLAEAAMTIPAESGQAESRLRKYHLVLAANARVALQTPPARRQKDGSSLLEPIVRVRGNHDAALPHLAGGNLPVEPADAMPQVLTTDAVADARSMPLAMAPNKDTQTTDGAVSEFADLIVPVTGADNGRRKEGDSTSAFRPGVVPAVAIVSSDETSSGSPSDNEIEEAARPTSMNRAASLRPESLDRLLDLSRRITSGDPKTIEQAAKELREAGLDETHLRIAEGVINLDPAVRREALEAFGAMANFDTRPWLVWLSQDDDADVRRTAITLMATSGDPKLQKRVQAAADSDPDPRVREQARRAVKR